MIKSILKFSLLGLLAIAVTGTPIVLRAQDASTTNTNKPSANPSARGLPFHGKVKAIDSSAMTITVAARTFQITSQTKIVKDGKPATLSEGAVGDDIKGYVKKDTDGKWNAVSISFGTPKPKPAATSNTTTNTP